MTEANIMRRVMLACSDNGATVFRHNVGLGWAGKLISHDPAGRTVLEHARPLHAGLTKGAGDVLGWKTVTITPDMIGKRLAIFTSIEVKDKGGKPSADQVNWLNFTRESGCLSGIARDEQQAIQILNGF